MPRFDPEMKSGKLVEWLKHEGDSVTKGEPIALIDTEKVSIEIESPESGVLSEVLGKAGEDIPVGTRIGAITVAGETKEPSEPIARVTGPTSTEPPLHRDGPSPQESLAPSSAQTHAEAGGPANWLRASPAARRLASELGVDLKSVQGTGPNGRITQDDVAKKHSDVAKSLEASVITRGEPAQSKTLAATSEQTVFSVRKSTTMRIAIGERMVESWTKNPQVPLFAEFDLTQAEKFRAAMEKLVSRRVSLTAIMTKALANALVQFKHINARFENNEIHEYDDADISIAVALEEGLLTPVVRRANRKTASDISVEIEDLAERARSGKLLPSELRGGTTTVSNLGTFHVDSFIPIINPPQATILGVGRSRILAQGAETCTLTLVFDHRLTDGAHAARLLQKVKDYIESPYLLQMS